MAETEIEIVRFADVPGMGCFGELTIGNFECFTVEREWLDNVPNRSCVPDGLYHWKRDTYHRGGYPCLTLLDVPNRTHIKIHKGNTVDDLLGCIAPGMALGFVNSKWAVTRSRLAFDRIMQLAGARGTIRIGWSLHP